MSDVAIRVENLSKKFYLGERIGLRTFREALQDALARPLRRIIRGEKNAQAAEEKVDTDREIWALKGVSFEVKHGEVLGVIGPNGAGKSTLLKILSRITEPTGGYAEIRGRVGSLLEVGTGFHPELTGRENVFLNGAILGMSKAEIRRKFDDIVAFAGVEKFIDTPVKRYSSGMQVRLAFAVAAHLDPEILIIDEVLAVGDAEFQKRCLGKMNEVSRSGRTVLFVSHNMAAVQDLCTSALLLSSGNLVRSGPTLEIVGAYIRTDMALNINDLSLHPRRSIFVKPVFVSLQILDNAGREAGSLSCGSEITFAISLQSDDTLHELSIGIHIYNSLGIRVMTCHSAYQSRSKFTLVGRKAIWCRIPSLRLMPGRYYITLGAAAGGTQIDRIEYCRCIDILPSNLYGTLARIPPRDGFWLPEVHWEV